MKKVTVHQSLKVLLGAAIGGVTGLALSGAAGAQDYTDKLQLGTANPGGGYYTMGSEYANIFEKNIDVDGLSVSAIQTSGSVDNLSKISRGEIELGLSQATTAALIFSGEGKYKNVNTDPIGLLGCLEPYALHAFTLKDSGIDSLQALAGKRVAIGAPGSAHQLASEALLAAYGLADGDYQAFPEASDDARQKLRANNLDVIVDVQPGPFPGRQELESACGGVKLLAIDDEELQKLLDNSDFSPFDIPQAGYDFIDAPIQTVSDWSCLFASNDTVSPELGYALVQTLYEAADELTLPAKASIRVETARPDGLELPLHAGAQKYLDEQQ